MHAIGETKVDLVKAVIAVACEPPCSAPELDVQTRLMDVGIDSLKFMLLIVEVEEVVGGSVFAVDQIGQIVTVDDVLQLVRNKV